MVNATQMAKPFGKRPANWIKTQQAKDLLEAVSGVKKVVPTDLQLVVNGGKRYGTWFQEDVALCFAQWLSPEFYVLCNDKLKELLAKGISKNAGMRFKTVKGIKYLWYNDVLLKNELSMKSGSYYSRIRKNPQEFLHMDGDILVTETYADYIESGTMMRNRQRKIRERRLLYASRVKQLQINFDNAVRRVKKEFGYDTL